MYAFDQILAAPKLAHATGRTVAQCRTAIADGYNTPALAMRHFATKGIGPVRAERKQAEPVDPEQRLNAHEQRLDKCETRLDKLDGSDSDTAKQARRATATRKVSAPEGEMRKMLGRAPNALELSMLANEMVDRLVAKAPTRPASAASRPLGLPPAEKLALDRAMGLVEAGAITFDSSKRTLTLGGPVSTAERQRMPAPALPAPTPKPAPLPSAERRALAKAMGLADREPSVQSTSTRLVLR
jgi:hypothetical protein